MVPRRSKRRNRIRYSRKEIRRQQQSNNFLVVLLSLIVLFETILLLFLIPKKIPTKAVLEVQKEEVKVQPKKIITKKPIKKKVPKRIKGKVAIVIDDWGYNTDNLDLLSEINSPLTLAILPFRNYSSRIAEFGHEHNFEIIIHMPMEPDNKERVGLEPRTLITNMGDETIKMVLNDAFDNIPYAKGMSNHMGSFATKDEKFIRVIFKELKKNKLYFLDSFVIPDSICHKVSRQIGIRFAKRSIFLDNKSDLAYIRGQLMELIRKVDRFGHAIGIGHDKKNTLSVLKEVIPQLLKQGYKFVFVSELVD